MEEILERIKKNIEFHFNKNKIIKFLKKFKNIPDIKLEDENIIISFEENLRYSYKIESSKEFVVRKKKWTVDVVVFYVEEEPFYKKHVYFREKHDINKDSIPKDIQMDIARILVSNFDVFLEAEKRNKEEEKKKKFGE